MPAVIDRTRNQADMPDEHPSPASSMASMMGLSGCGQAPYAQALDTIRDLEAQLAAAHRMRDSLLLVLNGAIAPQGMAASFDARGTLLVAPVPAS